MTTSASTNFSINRDDLINAALRKINELGTGETASATRITEVAFQLNLLIKEWQADGMQLWKQQTVQITPLTAGTGTYTIGVGSTVNTTAPLRITNAFRRVTATSADAPLILMTKLEYDTFSTKTSQGTPTQFYYNPPGPAGASLELQGTISLLPVPDTSFVSDQTLWVTGWFPIEDFDAAGDTPDVPSYWYNALLWGLADQMSYDAGLPLAERQLITAKADKHKEHAMSLDQEEGTITFGPNHWY